MARQPISKSLRFSIFKRDGFACMYCGAHPPTAVLEADHILAVANGGTNDETNLVTACFNCNRGKGASSLSDIPKSLADRAEETAEREEQIAGYEAVMRSKRERVEAQAEQILTRIFEAFSRMESVPTVDFLSIKRFIDRIGFDETFDAAEVAIIHGPNQFFKYFCGVCWRKIREAQE